MDNYTIIINKLRKFKRKYYLNKLLRGLILSVTIVLLIFLGAVFFEYFGYNNEQVRQILFYTLLGVDLLVLVFYIFIPLLKVYNLGKTIDDVEAARFIGNHFPEVKDKLLNAMQLRKSAKLSDEQAALIIASINQKTKELTPVPFQNAISYKVNRKYLKYALPVVFIFMALLLVSPTLITEPSKRIIAYNRHFEKPAPFSINISNDELSSVQNNDFVLEVATTGEMIPEDLYIHYNGRDYRMKNEAAAQFSYKFSKLQNTLDFNIYYGDFNSEKYTLLVYPRPTIVSFEAQLDYPAYTGKTDEIIENDGDLIVPEGTRVNWKFYTRDVDLLNFSYNKKDSLLEKSGANTFAYSRNIRDNARYGVWAGNDFIKKTDSLNFSINAIKDAWPTIIVEQQQDSTARERLFFTGLVKDDHGFSNLTFNYAFSSSPDSVVSESLYNLISSGSNQNQFYYSANLRQLNLMPGQEMEYYFEVWDNDAVNGRKKSKSKVFSYRLPTMDEVYDELNTENDQIEKGLEERLEDLMEVNQEIDAFSKELLQKEKLDWQDKQKAENLMKKEQEIRDNVEDLIKRNQENLNRFEQTKEESEIMEKQRQLQELLEKVLDDETKKMIDEINKMLEEFDKDKMMEMMEKVKMSNEDLEKQLDRNIELMKQIEYERMMNDLAEKLKEMSEKQEELSEKSAEKKEDKEALMEQQEELQKEFEDVKEDFKELEEKNEELEDPFEEPDLEEQKNSIQQEMQESMENMQKSKMKNASENQKNASQKMSEMAEMMMQSMQAQTMQQMGEDIAVVREILENLVEASFDQERIIADLSRMEKDDPDYPEILKRQNDLKDNLGVAEDSLIALSKRQPVIEGFVLNEIDDAHDNIELALDAIKENHVQIAATRQQYVMTSINNLALFLSESLDQMKNKMNMQSQNQMKGKGNCQSPGGQGSNPMKGMKNLQQQLNQQMQQLQNSMQGKGKDGKQGKQGKNGQNGGQSMNEQLARMAAEQAAIREKLQNYIEELKEQGLGDQGLSKALEEMEKTEEELVNKKVSQSMIERQQEILSRLLKSERAELEREKKKERESKEAKNVKRSNPGTFSEYKSLKSNEAELLKTVSPKLNIFYRKKVNAYFYKSGIME